jgi:beta-lactamase superfamily II metal-dependent hydrolase
MAELIGVQAEEGDCLLLGWQHDGDAVWVLIDGGPPKTYRRSLEPTLAELGVGHLHLVINSHVDADHVAGLLELFSERIHGETAPTMAELWHNQFAQTIDKNGTVKAKLKALAGLAALPASLSAMGRETLDSYAQGGKLVKLAAEAEVSVNASNDGKPWVLDGPPVVLELAGGLTARLVGPTRANLAALEAAWIDYLEKVEAKPAAMADKSKPNLSSIQLLVEHDGKTMLLTGDGRGDHLLEGLESQGLLDGDGGIDVDILKVPHHGSQRNVDAKFFERVRAKQYLISANGKHGNPDPPTLGWILAAAKKQAREIEMVFTNALPQIDEFANALAPGDPCKIRVRDPGSQFIRV